MWQQAEAAQEALQYISIGGPGFSPSNMFLGYRAADPLHFDGLMANLQIYNTALNASQARQLYNGGIAAAPLSGAGNVAWWPLQGDANDYSSYNNTGYPTNVVYVQGNYLPSGYPGASTISVSSTMVPYSKYQGFNDANSLYNNNPKLYKVGVYSWK